MRNPATRQLTAFTFLLAWCEACSSSASENEVWRSLADAVQDPSLKEYIERNPGRYKALANPLIVLAREIGLRHVDPEGTESVQWMYQTLRLNHAVSVTMLSQLRRYLETSVSQRLLNEQDPLYSRDYAQLRSAIDERDKEFVIHSAWISKDAADTLVKLWVTDDQTYSHGTPHGDLARRFKILAKWTGYSPSFTIDLQGYRALGLAPGRIDIYIGSSCQSSGLVQVNPEGAFDTFGWLCDFGPDMLGETLSVWKNGIPVQVIANELVSDEVIVFDGATGKQLSTGTPRRSGRSYIVGAPIGTTSSHADFAPIEQGGRLWFRLPSGWPPDLALAFQGLDVFRHSYSDNPYLLVHQDGLAPKRRGDRVRIRMEACRPFHVARVTVPDTSMSFVGFSDPPVNRTRKYEAHLKVKPNAEFEIEIAHRDERLLYKWRLPCPHYLDFSTSSVDALGRLSYDGILEVNPITATASMVTLKIGSETFDAQPFVGTHPVRWQIPPGTRGPAFLQVGAEEFPLSANVEASGWIRSVCWNSDAFTWSIEPGQLTNDLVFWSDHRLEVIPSQSQIALRADEIPFALAALSEGVLVGLWMQEDIRNLIDWSKEEALAFARWFGVLPHLQPKGWSDAARLFREPVAASDGRSAVFDHNLEDVLVDVAEPDLSASVSLAGLNWLTSVAQDCRLGVGILYALRRLDVFTRLQALGSISDGPTSTLPRPSGRYWLAQYKVKGDEALRCFAAMRRSEVHRTREEGARSFVWFSEHSRNRTPTTLSALLAALLDLESFPGNHPPVLYLVNQIVDQYEELDGVGYRSLLQAISGHSFDSRGVRSAIRELDQFTSALNEAVAVVNVYPDEPWFEVIASYLSERSLSNAILCQDRIDKAFSSGEDVAVIESAVYLVSLQVKLRRKNESRSD